MMVMTAGINNRIADDVNFSKHVTDSIGRFVRQDWGEIEEDSKQMNDEAIISRMGIHASYGTGDDHIWIIKDAFDGPTTILYPSEY